MGGGLMQLVAYGAQDIYLTGNPQITFFKVVYRRHTNFSMESIEQTFNGTADFGKRVTATISRNGDLIYRMYVQATLPEIKHSNSGAADVAGGNILGFRWTNWIGHKLLKEVEIEIGGQRIDKHYSSWLHIWNELTQTAGHKVGYASMVGNVPRLVQPMIHLQSGTDSNQDTKPETTLYIPLQFWFCRNPGLALPLIALQYHEVKINVVFEDLNNCRWIATKAKPTTAIDTTTIGGVEMVVADGGAAGAAAESTALHDTTQAGTDNGDNVAIDGNAQSIGVHVAENLALDLGTGQGQWAAVTAGCCKHSLVSCSLWVDYIYLDTDERRRFAQVSHEYLIEQLQFTGDESVSGTSSKVKLNFNHPVKELVWVTQMDAVVADSDTTRNVGGAQWFNFTTALDNTYTSGTPTDPLGEGMTGPNAPNSGLPYHLVSEQNSIKWDDFMSMNTVGANGISQGSRFLGAKLHDLGKNPTKKAKLQLNGHDRFAEREGRYFNLVQPYQHHTNVPAIGVNVYSFGLKPEEHQPSGTCNMSRIDNATLTLTNETSDAGVAKVFAVNYNVLRIMSGMGGLAYSN